MTRNDSGNENTSGMKECRENMSSVVETNNKVGETSKQKVKVKVKVIDSRSI